MKHSFVSVLGLMTVIFAIQSSASSQKILLKGVDSSGGGNAVVCRDSNDRIKSAELLDLFEAKVLYGLTIPTRHEPAADQAKARATTLKTLNKNFFYFFPEDLQKVMSLARILPDGVGLQPINDSFSPVLPKNCKIEQLAAYQINNELYIDGEIWKALDEANRAGLYLHETLYKKMRELGAKDSIRSRKIVGHLLAGYAFNPVFNLDGGAPGDKLCVSDEPFWMASVEFGVHFHDDIATVHFISLMKQPLVTDKALDVPKDLFAAQPPGSAQAVMKPMTSQFEDGDAVQIFVSSEGVKVTIKNALGNASLDGKFDVHCN